MHSVSFSSPRAENPISHQGIFPTLPKEIVAKIFSFLPLSQVEEWDFSLKEMLPLISVQSQSSPIPADLVLRAISKDVSKTSPVPIGKLRDIPAGSFPRLLQYGTSFKSLHFKDHVNAEILASIAKIETLRSLTIWWPADTIPAEAFSVLGELQLEELVFDNCDLDFQDEDVEIVNQLRFIQNMPLKNLEIYAKCTNALLELLPKSLRTLCFWGDEHVNEEGLRSLASLPQLETLSLPPKMHSDAVVVELSGLPLKNLYLHSEQRWDQEALSITDQGLARLPQWSKLQSLRISGHNFSDEGLRSLERLPDLTDLTIADNGRITGATLDCLSTTLETFTLENVTDIQPEHLSKLERLQRLRYFEWIDEYDPGDDREFIQCVGPRIDSLIVKIPSLEQVKDSHYMKYVGNIHSPAFLKLYTSWTEEGRCEYLFLTREFLAMRRQELHDEEVTKTAAQAASSGPDAVTEPLKKVARTGSS